MRLVERAPADDRRVRVVPLQRLEPFGDVRRRRPLAVGRRAVAADAPVAELAPHEVAEPVRVEQVSLLEDLLVQAGTVEPGREAELDVPRERGVRRRRHERLRPVALVQDEPLEDRLAVDPDRQSVDGDGAQAGVGAHGVDEDAVRVAQLDVDAVQVRVARSPGAHAVRGDDGAQRGRQVEVGAGGGGRHLALGVGHGDGHRVAAPVRRQWHHDVERRAGQVRRDAWAAQVHGRYRLQPHRLPDARRAGVVALEVRVAVALLAPGLRPVARVPGPHDDGDRVPRVRDAVQVGRERGEPAAVPHDLRPVDPHRRVVVDRAEVQQDVRVVADGGPLRGDGDLAAVPDGFEEVGVLDAGELRLGRERDDDLALERALDEAALETGVARVDLELPGAVEVQPTVAGHLRAGVLGARYGGGRWFARGREAVEEGHQLLHYVYDRCVAIQHGFRAECNVVSRGRPTGHAAEGVQGLRRGCSPGPAGGAVPARRPARRRGSRAAR